MAQNRMYFFYIAGLCNATCRACDENIGLCDEYIYHSSMCAIIYFSLSGYLRFPEKI